MTEAAREIGLTRRAMALRMKRYHLTYQQFRRKGGAPAKREEPAKAALPGPRCELT